MPLIGGEIIVGMLQTFRVIWIGGRYGGGKTALAFRLAYELLDSGFSRYLLSNCRSVWGDAPADVVLREGRYLDTVVILDEGGLFLRTGKDADDFLAFLRKLNVVLIVPSVKPPAPAVRMVSVQRTANLQSIGLPAWVYTASVEYGRQRDRERFLWWQPSEIYGVYDTADVPVDDCGIGDYLLAEVDKLVKASGHGTSRRNKRAISILEGGGWDAGAGVAPAVDTASEVIADAAAEFAGAISLLGEFQDGRKRRR